jgi:hypothetical protein
MNNETIKKKGHKIIKINIAVFFFLKFFFINGFNLRSAVTQEALVTCDLNICFFFACGGWVV